jgi:D-alanyl-D-alanine dipeptidase
MNHPFMDIPITATPGFSWEASRAVPIDECGEEMVAASLIPEKILVRPQYFLHMLEGAIPECYVRRSVLERLLEASEMLPDGCRLVLLDTWRSRNIQTTLFQKFRSELREKMPLLDDAEITVLASQFVAPPSLHPERPSPHITGGAVDLTIVDKMGFCLPMGTGFDETSEKSATVWYEKKFESKEAMSEDEMDALHNRRLLYYVMHKAGFTNYPDEWWHYDYGNQNWALLRGKKHAVFGVTEPAFRWRSL